MKKPAKKPGLSQKDRREGAVEHLNKCRGIGAGCRECYRDDWNCLDSLTELFETHARDAVGPALFCDDWCGEHKIDEKHHLEGGEPGNKTFQTS